jgi:hypothetical protein
MITSLSKILFDFPGAANRARCTAHIVNLVSKIILRQFDARKKAKVPKKTTEKANNELPELVDEDDEDDDLISLAEGLDREEQEVADDEDDDMSENIAVDVEEIEEELKEEVLEVAKVVKPIQRVLFKVR